MKAYRWLTLFAAVLITAFEVLFLAAAGRTAGMASPTSETGRIPLSERDRNDLQGRTRSVRRRTARTIMNRFISIFLLVPVCSLSVGMAYAADAPAASYDAQSVAIVTAHAPPEEKSNTRLSLAGLGSLYWAARHPEQAWRVLLPIQPGGVAYADLIATCTVSMNASIGAADCP